MFENSVNAWFRFCARNRRIQVNSDIPAPVSAPHAPWLQWRRLQCSWPKIVVEIRNPRPHLAATSMARGSLMCLSLMLRNRMTSQLPTSASRGKWLGRRRVVSQKRDLARVMPRKRINKKLSQNQRGVGNVRATQKRVPANPRQSVVELPNRKHALQLMRRKPRRSAIATCRHMSFQDLSSYKVQWQQICMHVGPFFFILQTAFRFTAGAHGRARPWRCRGDTCTNQHIHIYIYIWLHGI